MNIIAILNFCMAFGSTNGLASTQSLENIVNEMNRQSVVNEMDKMLQKIVEENAKQNEIYSTLFAKGNFASRKVFFNRHVSQSSGHQRQANKSAAITSTAITSGANIPRRAYNRRTQAYRATNKSSYRSTGRRYHWKNWSNCLNESSLENLFLALIFLL